jgi:hypothetical protein
MTVWVTEPWPLVFCWFSKAEHTPLTEWMWLYLLCA